MLELTRKPHTEGYVEVRAIVPESRYAAVARAIEQAAEPDVPGEDVFPDSTPGSRLRGARGLREMTQARLAELTGVSVPNISAMENGRRPIGKAMARKLGEALEFSYKVFL
ncbi:MAG: helix-turn-helix domain-containing protein [Thermodesulfobacteriota bacterium]